MSLSHVLERAPGRPAQILRPISFLALALVGCGGSRPSSPSRSGVPSVTRLAVAPTDVDGTPHSGYDASGEPVYGTRADNGRDWVVSSSADKPLYTIALPFASSSHVGAVEGPYVLGDYLASDGTSGVAVSTRGADGSVSVASYPGYGFDVCQGGRAVVESSADGSHATLDLASGVLTPEAIPMGDVPYAMDGRYVLCAAGTRGLARLSGSLARARPRVGKRDTTSAMLLYDLAAHSSVPLKAPADSDGSVYAYVLNARGQALGVTYQGTRTDLRLWSADGTPGPALDSIVDGYVEPGWLAEDASELSYDKAPKGAGDLVAYLRVGGTSYALDAGPLPLGEIYGLDAKGTVGFGLDAQGNTVTVGISYR